MNKVKVLIEGFAEKFENYKTVSPSVVLIETDKYKIIVDPGLNRENLLKALEKENLKTDQIDYVILTHYHLDHSALMGIFEKAIILDDESKYQQNGEISKQKENMLGNEIQIISTPGHDPWHCSVLVKTEDLGNVVVAGDLFWWRNGFEPKKDYENILNLVDPFVKDQKALIESRKKILEMADWIIPGHGKMFKNLNK
jgi:glyoxylase-like metal-dependent hydrolase (beta-lactamase superfamily II)